MITILSDIEGLIFDCDGTLADSMAVHHEAWRVMLAEHGVEFSKAFFARLGGVPMPRIVEMVNEAYGSRMEPQAAAGRQEELFLQRLHHVRPIEVVVDVVRRYAGRVPMAVASGSGREAVEGTLRTLGLMDCFSVVLASGDVEHGKPAPDIFLEAARRMNVKPERCCVLEDGEAGLVGARAAGMHVIDVRGYLSSPTAPQP